MQPYGPSKIPATRQIALPAELLKAINVKIGDKVYVFKAEDIEGALTVVPRKIVEGWIDVGRSQVALPSAVEDIDSD